MEEDYKRFNLWLTHIKKKAEQIYILGDLFDYWYSGINSSMSEVFDALKDPRIHLLPGNRDFLLVNLSSSGINIIQSEELLLNIYGNKVLIAHGHTLVKADLGFKCLHTIGWPILQFLDRHLSISGKDTCARFMVKSSSAIRPPSATIPDDIAETRGVDIVICGHLHRAIMNQRLIVLPAFFNTQQCLSWDSTGYRFCIGE